MSIRPVKRLIKAKPTLEGAGVHLRRAFGFGNTSDFDPFLLLDDFRNDVPEDYLAGFPWHPHRGIETVTYVLAGTVEHGDSMGNQGAIAAGDVQWMTAGSGIIHQEMPKGDQSGRMHGFQLWGNLPSSLKMTPPRYQEVKAMDIPKVTDDDGKTTFPVPSVRKRPEKRTNHSAGWLIPGAAQTYDSQAGITGAGDGSARRAGWTFANVALAKSSRANAAQNGNRGPSLSSLRARSM